MTSLRDRKKEASRKRIIHTAEELFAAKGIDATTMDEIAALADVSVATVYNYFGTKTALILAGVEDDTDRMIDEGASVLAAPGLDAHVAVKRLFGIYIEHLTAWDRHLLGEVMVAMFRPGGDQLASGLAQTDERLIGQLVELLEHYRFSGALQADVSSEEAALLLFSAMAAQLFSYLSLDGQTARELNAQVARQVDLAFTGLARTKAT